MTRPIYEKETDRANQERIATLLEKFLGVKCIQTPALHTFDFELTHETDSSIAALVEFKKRNRRHDEFSTYFISKAKIVNAVNIAKSQGKPFLLMVEWTDKVGFVIIDNVEDYDTRRGGRTDRNDKKDVEPMLHIPIADFTFL